MVGVTFLLPIWFDLTAVFLFALTGVWAATKRGYDVVGAFVLAFVAGVGGGLLRDAIFLGEMPVVMKDARFLYAVLAALVIGALAQRLAERFDLLLAYVDAAAIGVYAVYGANKSLVAGVPPEAAVLVGMCNAVGGGLIRDVVVRDEPLLLKPGQLYVLASFVGCAGFVLMSHHYGIDVEFAAWTAIVVTIVLRALAIRFNWRTSALGAIWRRRDS
ncbi:MAG TPA: TRIC cation channel family protein [Burkholderiales bacterium]|nr:TRIC cation channel family protein [Burkholderiales bacterium]